MAFDIGSIFDSRDSIEYLVSQYIKLESRPRDRIIENRARLTTKQQTLTTLDSKLSALNSSAERMTDEITDYFAVNHQPNATNVQVIQLTEDTLQCNYTYNP